jgi:hypothetical protein
MSQTFTAVQAVKLQREAFCEGAIFGRGQVADFSGNLWYPAFTFQTEAGKKAEEACPMPQVERPRVIKIKGGLTGLMYPVSFDTKTQRYSIESYGALTKGKALSHMAILEKDDYAIAADVQALTDLAANPTELVDAE